MELDGGVRVIGRGLAILKVLNRYGSLDMTSIAKATSLPHRTASRIIDTLIQEGMVEREPGRKFYRPGSLVRTLSYGYSPGDELASASRTVLTELTRVHLWPVAVCSRVGSNMVLRESSHALSPKTLSMFYPGDPFPMLGGSSGLTYLAFCGDEEREAVLRSLEESGDLGGAYTRRALAHSFEEARRRGFGALERCAQNANPGKTSSLSVPIIVGGACEGTMTLIFISSTMSMTDAANLYAGQLMDAAAVVVDNLSAGVSSTTAPRKAEAVKGHGMKRPSSMLSVHSML